MPAVSRHLEVLERAALISRTQRGRLRASNLEPAPLRDAADWIERYRRFWESSLTRLDAHLAAVQAAERAADPTAAGPGAQEGMEPFETGLRVDFHDGADGRGRERRFTDGVLLLRYRLRPR